MPLSDNRKVLFIPSLRNNLFSLTAETARGSELTNRGNVLVLKMPDLSEIIFDCLMKSKMGCVVGIDVTVDKDDLIKMSRDRFHQACGHQWGGFWM